MRRKKILVPVNIESCTVEFLVAAAQLASSIHARISFVSVMEQDKEYEGEDKSVLQKRREVEVELSKIVNSSFKDKKPEFDIIVTQGNFSRRIMQMAGDLNVSLIAMQTREALKFKPVMPLLVVPILFFEEIISLPKQLFLPIHLDNHFRKRVEESSEAALLLNLNLHMTLYVNSYQHEDKNLAIRQELMAAAEEKGVLCSCTINAWNFQSGTLLAHILRGHVEGLPIISCEEFEKISLNPGLFQIWQSRISLLIPNIKTVEPGIRPQIQHNINNN